MFFSVVNKLVQSYTGKTHDMDLRVSKLAPSSHISFLFSRLFVWSQILQYLVV